MPNPRILIIASDRLLQDALGDAARRAFRGGARTIAASCAEARAVSWSKFDLIVACATLFDGDVLDLLPSFEPGAARKARMIVIADRKDPRLLDRLQKTPVNGIFDPGADGLTDLASALKAVAKGRGYLSPTLEKRMRLSVDKSEYTRFTPLERLVFAAVGDGATNEVAAPTLNLAPATVQAVRRDLHRKLQVNDRAELMHAAIRLGFVRITPDGTARPGFKKMLADYQAKRRRGKRRMRKA